MKTIENHFNPRSKDIDAIMSKRYSVQVPPLPQEENATSLNEIFYITNVSDLVLYPASDNPLALPPTDFFFGGDVFLENSFIKHKSLPAYDLMSELNSSESRLLNWQSGVIGAGDALANKWRQKILQAKSIAYVSAHGDMMEGPYGVFWGIYAINSHYNADQILSALIAEKKYDLLVFTSCNRDGIPFAVETNGQPHPDIIRFTMTNSFLLVGNTSPIHFIPSSK